MTRKRILTFSILVLIGLTLPTACSGDPSSGPDEGSQGTAGETGSNPTPTPTRGGETVSGSPAAANPQKRRRARRLVDEANDLRGRLDYLSAIAKYKEALALDPNNADAILGARLHAVPKEDALESKKLTGQGIQLAQMGNFGPAFQILGKAKDLDSNNIKAARNYGNCALETRRYHRAREVFDAIIAAHPTEIEPRLNGANAAYLSRDFKGCLQYLRDMQPLMPEIEKDPRYSKMVPQLWFLRGFAANQEHLIPEAIDALQRATRLAPENATYHHNLGGVYLEDGKFDLAKRSLEESLKLEPNSVRNFYFIGRALDKMGEKKQAIEWYKKTIRADNTHWLACVHAARCYEALGGRENLLGAVTFLELALKKNDLSHEALFTMSGVQRKLGDKDEANLYLERYNKINDIAKAQEEKLRAISKRVRANPEAVEPRLEALEIHSRFAHLDDAIEEVSDLLLIHPEHPEALWRYALLLRTKKDPRAGYLEAIKLIEIEPEAARGHTVAAYCAMDMGMVKRAMEHAEAGYQLDQNDFGAVEMLVLTYQRLGGRQERLEKLLPVYEQMKAANEKALEEQRRAAAAELEKSGAGVER